MEAPRLEPLGPSWMFLFLSVICATQSLRIFGQKFSKGFWNDNGARNSIRAPHDEFTAFQPLFLPWPPGRRACSERRTDTSSVQMPSEWWFRYGVL